jgi:protease PrsW
MTTAAASPIRWILRIGVFLGMAFLGLLTLMMIGALNTGFVGLVAGMILATLPVPFYLGLALWIDRYEREPVAMLLLAFLWGATGAVFFSFIANSINGAILGMVGMEGLSAALSAPWVEESAKGIALLALFFWKKDEFDNVTDGIVYATMVGLGFAMTENISYYGSALANGGVGASLVTVVLRGVVGPFAHPLFTAMTGIGLGLARESTRRPVQIGAPFLGFCGAMFLHFLWNLSATLGNAAYFGAYLLIMVPTFFAVLGLIFYSLRREARIIRANLQGYVASGVLSAEEVDRLCSVTGRMGASWSALTSGGMGTWQAIRRHHQAASELAFHHWRVSRGISAGAQADAEREQFYLSQLYRAQSQEAQAQATAAAAV